MILTGQKCLVYSDNDRQSTKMEFYYVQPDKSVRNYRISTKPTHDLILQGRRKAFSKQPRNTWKSLKMTLNLAGRSLDKTLGSTSLSVLVNTTAVIQCDHVCTLISSYTYKFY